MNNWVFDIEGVDCSGKVILVKKLVGFLRIHPVGIAKDYQWISHSMILRQEGD